MSEAPTRSWQVVGKEGFGDGRRSQAMAGVQPTGGGGGSVGGGIDARSRSFPPHTLFHSRFNSIQAQVLPAILYLDVGQCETILQRPGHLRRIRQSAELFSLCWERLSYARSLTLETCTLRKTLLATSSGRSILVIAAMMSGS